MTDITHRLRYYAESPLEAPEDLLIAAAAEIKRLQAELANLRAADIHSCHDGCARAGCVNGRLRAQVAGLEADAGRYRWLRDKFSRIACNVNLAWDAAQAETTKIESLWVMEHFRATDPESTDAAIDAARKGEA